MISKERRLKNNIKYIYTFSFSLFSFCILQRRCFIKDLFYCWDFSFLKSGFRSRFRSGMDIYLKATPTGVKLIFTALSQHAPFTCWKLLRNTDVHVLPDEKPESYRRILPVILTLYRCHKGSAHMHLVVNLILKWHSAKYPWKLQ